jgi:hypothetical protein
MFSAALDNPAIASTAIVSVNFFIYLLLFY